MGRGIQLLFLSVEEKKKVCQQILLKIHNFSSYMNLYKTNIFTDKTEGGGKKRSNKQNIN